MEGGVGRAGDEAVGVEEGAHAAKRDAHGDRGGDAGPAGHRRPAPARHQGEFSPAGHLLLQPGRDPAGRMGGRRGFLPSGGAVFGPGVSVTLGFVVLEDEVCAGWWWIR